MDARYREIFAALKTEIVDLHLRWIIYRQLYGTSEEAVDVLNRSGSNVFFLLQQLLLDDCALRISKLTDPVDQGKVANLSVVLRKYSIRDELTPLHGLHRPVA